jgi:ethanolamine ammonia-lyase small subunit
VRVRDKHRDIIEIKSPFIQVLRKDGELSSEFNEAWNQCERYLDFAKEEKEYLRRKGFSFDNPRCYLIIGHQLSEEALRKIRVKEKMNPTIEVLTYDGLAAFASRTVQWINGLQGKT